MINGILAAEELIASRVAHTFRTYPKQITAAIAALLLSAGGGAFAVASLGPDASELPVRQVFEAVQPSAFADQVEALDAHSFTLFRTDLTRSSDTAEALLQRLGLSDPDAAAFVRGNAEARNALLGRAGRTVTAEATQENALKKLSARWIPDGDGGFKRLVVEKTPNGFRARTETDALTPGTRLASGIVRTSLFAATDDARIPDPVATQLADIFATDVDFRSLRKGDRFAVVYETFDADGQTLRSGRVLSAEFESNGKLYQALWFQEPGQKGGYYRPNGDSLRRAYLSSPVEFTRVSSGFAMRMHPILNSWRQHHGIDFSAPTGTPVRAVGDGTVEFAGTQNGYGNIVIVKHRNNQETAYAHLSRIDVKTGQSISQSQTLGAVGSTGWATGPHLHFEFRVDGEYRDPTTIAQQEGGMPITAAARPAFERLAIATRTELAAAFSVVQASAD
ncbi:peptidoglycan DD-metalloendopeptidase family protein [Variovorax sp. J22P168]|uniref:peptidoglycan DD-metalloendopeptidase family protein n=1 Tax=Variovorax jilinensis TaxID=3053513 RepID=UPI0025781733|nr:peptidoglycan DD-metalloendopeptidase family protein [Variovorax sp. J22P168]MDM0012316.1 peptidoglycan DD-metalloendopeptidase family protein [Variovorax sp. J22P168]